MPSNAELGAHIAAVRRFNRFYTRQIGVLEESLLDSPFSLTQSRVLYELALRTNATATELATVLALDAGYLSRVLRGLTRQRLLRRTRSADDRRQYHVTLTPAGQRAFVALDRRSHAHAHDTLRHLTAQDRQRVIGAMSAIEALLTPTPAPTLAVAARATIPRTTTTSAIADRPATALSYLLRDPLPGDLGWVIARQAALYAKEYHFDRRFEGLIASVIGEFVANFDATGERCWIAERDGAIIGSIFLVRKSARVAKLRMLYVEPSARGLGVGRRLVQECMRAARQFGYARMTLWTNSVLVSARRIYEAEGFQLIEEHGHTDLGPALVGQTWETDL
jgi:DNA-binding MarR family transcriptional regulator/GNAT superfamily N-acetyltransferase